MLYEVRLSPAELKLLASLIGTPLEAVVTDGWGVGIRVSGRVLSVTPEEVATPDAEHPVADVERPTVRVATEPFPGKHDKVVAERLGTIRAVNIISTLVGFSPVVVCPPEKLRGVTLPASRGYGWVHFPTTRRKEAEREVGAGSLVELDVAFELVAAGCLSLVVYTSGYWVMVSLTGVPAAESWAAHDLHARRQVS